MLVGLASCRFTLTIKSFVCLFVFVFVCFFDEMTWKLCCYPGGAVCLSGIQYGGEGRRVAFVHATLGAVCFFFLFFFLMK